MIRRNVINKYLESVAGILNSCPEMPEDQKTFWNPAADKELLNKVPLKNFDTGYQNLMYALFHDRYSLLFNDICLEDYNPFCWFYATRWSAVWKTPEKTACTICPFGLRKGFCGMRDGLPLASMDTYSLYAHFNCIELLRKENLGSILLDAIEQEDPYFETLPKLGGEE